MWDVSGALRRHVYRFKTGKISCQRQTGSAFDGANLHSVVEGGGGSGVGRLNPSSLANLERFYRHARTGGEPRLRG